jgi:hypothetical protein
LDDTHGATDVTCERTSVMPLEAPAVHLARRYVIALAQQIIGIFNSPAVAN